MTNEEDWGDIDSLPPAKDGIPRWLWCCGCGCLLPIVVVLVLGVWGWKIVDEGRDPVKAQAQLESSFEVEELAEGWKIEFGRKFGWAGNLEFYLFSRAAAGEGEEREEHPLAAVLIVAPEGADVEKDLHPDEDAEVEPFQITVQGRVLNGVRASQEGAAPPFPFLPAPEDGARASVDFTEEKEGARQRVLVLVRQGSTEPITDDEIREFLAPFHIGPEKDPERDTEGDSGSEPESDSGDDPESGGDDDE